MANDLEAIGDRFQAAMTMQETNARAGMLGDLTELYLDVNAMAETVLTIDLSVADESAVLDILDQSLVSVLGRHGIYDDLTVAFVPVTAYSEPLSEFLCASVRVAFQDRLVDVSEAIIGVSQAQVDAASERVQQAEAQLNELQGDLELLHYGIYPEARDILQFFFGQSGGDGATPQYDDAQLNALQSALDQERSEVSNLIEAIQTECSADTVLFSNAGSAVFAFNVVTVADRSRIVGFDSASPAVSLRQIDGALENIEGSQVASVLANIFLGE